MGIWKQQISIQDTLRQKQQKFSELFINIKPEHMEIIGLVIQIKFLSLLFLAFSCLMPRIWSLTLDIQATDIFPSKDQYRIELKLKNQLSAVSFNFSRLPGDWKQVEKYLFVTRPSQPDYNQVAIGVAIKDLRTGQQLQVSLIFIYNSEKMRMDKTIYNFDIQNPVNKIQLPGSDSTTSKQTPELNIAKIIQDARVSSTPLSQSLNMLFYRLMTDQEIIAAIQANNIFAVAKMVNLLAILDNLNCIQKIAYLSNIASIASDVLQKKEQQLQDILKKGNTNSAPVSVSVSNIGQDNTGTKELKDKTDAKIEELRKKYSDLKQVLKNQMDNLQQSYMDEILELQKQEKIKNQLATKYGELEQISSSIDNALMINFNNLRSSGSTLTKINSIIKEQQAKTDTDSKALANLRQVIAEQEKEKKKVADNLTQIEVAIFDRESSVISTFKALQDTDKSLFYLYQLPNSYQSVTINSDFVVNARKDLVMMNSTLEYLDWTLDQVYWSCYGLKNVKRSQDVTLPIYEIDYVDLMNYVRKFSKKDQPNLISSIPSKKIVLTKTSVISSEWRNAFGSNSTSNRKIDLSINCYSSAGLDGYTGVIESISGNVIQVVMNESMYFVLHGACSRIQMDKMPKKGNILFWRGRKLENNLFDSFYSLIL